MKPTHMPASKEHVVPSFDFDDTTIEIVEGGLCK